MAFGVRLGKSTLVLVPPKSPRDNPFVAVTLEEIPRSAPIRATCEHHGLCCTRINRCGDVNHASPSFYERASWHIAAFRRDDLNAVRQLPRNRHREAISSIHGAGETRRTRLSIKQRHVKWSHAPLVDIGRVADPQCAIRDRYRPRGLRTDAARLQNGAEDVEVFGGKFADGRIRRNCGGQLQRVTVRRHQRRDYDKAYSHQRLILALTTPEPLPLRVSPTHHLRHRHTVVATTPDESTTIAIRSITACRPALMLWPSVDTLRPVGQESTI
jgi:hypothetical protein